MKKKYVLTLACLCCMLLSQAQTLSKARELFNAGSYEEALPTFRKLVKQSPSNANYNYWYGVCCMETGADSIAGPYLTKAASRKVLDAYPYLTRLQMNTYKFDDAVSTCEDYIDLLTTRKKDTQEAEKLLEKARMGALMLRGTERVCVVDSFVVDKADFLSAYKTGPESGQTTMPDDSTFYYENELGQKRYWALTQSGRTDIYTSDKLLDKWSTPKPVKGLDTDGNNNYPYLLADGTTLYYANDGANSLGGYDIFVTRYNTDTDRYLKPENLGMPYNSTANDYLLVIDEFNNLGWFASDRQQPEGKVCIYVFVPNPSRETFDFDTDGAETVASRAKLTSIRDTWTDETTLRKARERIAIAIQSRQQQTINHDFTFVIDDQHTYHSLTDFSSDKARTLFQQFKQMQQDFRKLSSQLDGLRDRYASSPDGQKQQMTPQILDLEKRQEQMAMQLDELEIKARNTEKSHINR